MNQVLTDLEKLQLKKEKDRAYRRERYKRLKAQKAQEKATSKTPAPQPAPPTEIADPPTPKVDLRKIHEEEEKKRKDAALQKEREKRALTESVLNRIKTEQIALVKEGEVPNETPGDIPTQSFPLLWFKWGCVIKPLAHFMGVLIQEVFDRQEEVLLKNTSSLPEKIFNTLYPVLMQIQKDGQNIFEIQDGVITCALSRDEAIEYIMAQGD